jgi:WD40 repeat protein
MPSEFQRSYLLSLPLPLAQLYGRAYNGKDARGRHDNTFYLFEALVKLTAAPAVAAYLNEVEQGAPRVDGLDRLLIHLALPSLGQWVGLTRELASYFGTRPDGSSHPLGHLWDQLNRPRRDWAAILALYCRIKNGPDGQPAGDMSCSLLQLFDALVQYRNAVFGHGAGRFTEFYEQDMGPLLFPAVNEALGEGRLEPLGPRGSRLVYVTDVRAVDEGHVEIGLRDLVGLQGERMAPLVVEGRLAEGLVSHRVAVLWPGRPVPLSVHPLLLYRESEVAADVLFLNRDRNGRQVEYLSYTTGRTERDRDTTASLATLLGRATGRPVQEADLDALAEQSFSKTPSIEALLPQAGPTGQRLGDYDVLAELGRGGMGVVYLARQLSLGRLVALKMLPADLSGDERALARFRREVEVLARCEHSGIVKVLASGTLPDGRLYYTMEYVPGCTLEQVWRELSGEGHAASSQLGTSTWARAVLQATRKQREQVSKPHTTPAESAPVSPAPVALPLPPLPEPPTLSDTPGEYIRRVAGLARDAALALQTVHEHGIIHRDIKPGNLMLTPDGTRVVLMDFGLAKGQSLALTTAHQGGLLGTLRYAGPEQLASATLKVGPAADIRGLGVTLWELLTLRRLFADAQDEVQLAQCVHERDVPLLRTVDARLDRDLEAIVARATERRASERTASAGEFANLLQLYLEGRPLPIRPSGTIEWVWRWVRSHKGLAASVAAVLVALLVALVSGWMLYQKDQEDRLRSEREVALNALQLAFDAKLAHLDWSPQGLGEMEACLAEIGRLAGPESEAAHREQWRRQAREDMQKVLRAERLGPEDERRLREALDWWAAHDLALAEELRAALTRRRQDWQPLLRLQTAAADWQATFDAAVVQPVADALKPRFGSSSTLPALIPTRVRGEGNLHVEAVLQAPSWGRATRLGLGVNDTQGHTASVTWLAFQPPDGKLIASGSEDGTVKLWSPEKNRLVETLRDASDVGSLCGAFSPDGTLLATFGRDGLIHLWEIATGKHRRGRTGLFFVRTVSFSADGKLLLTSDGNNAVLWEMPTGKPLEILPPHDAYSPILSPDGKLLADVDFNNVVSLWDLTTGKVRAKLSGHTADLHTMAFNQSGSRLVTVDSAGRGKVWDVTAGKERGSFKTLASVKMAPSGDMIYLMVKMALSPDGTLLAVWESSGQLWDLGTGDRAPQQVDEIKDVGDMAFDPSGRVLVVSGRSALRLLDARTRQAGPALPRTNGAFPVAFDPTGKSLACATSGSRVLVWDVGAAQPRCDWGPDGCSFLVRVAASDQAESSLLANGREVHMGQVRAVAFSRDGTRMATAGYSALIIWSTASGKPVITLKNVRAKAARFSHDGKRLACWDDGSAVHVYDAGTGAEQLAFKAKQATLLDVVFSADDGEVYTVDSAGVVQARPLAGGEPRQLPLKRATGPASPAAFAPDGAAVALVSPQPAIVEVWDLKTGEKRGAAQVKGRMKQVALVPASELVVTVGEDKAARLWNLATGKEQRSFGQERGVTNVAVAPDGRSLATLGGDGMAIVWEVATGAWQATLDGESKGLSSGVYSSDGKFLALVGARVRLWDLRRGTLEGAVKAGDALRLEIHRDGKRLVDVPLKLPPGAAGQPLRLTAYLEDDRLTFQVNDSPPVTFQDLFPIRNTAHGFISLYWPAGVRLGQLQAWQRPPAPGGSLLEQGDELYLQKRYAEALTCYQDQAARATAPQVVQEARFKAALCQVALQRDDQAAESFRLVAADQGVRWPALAACHLCLLRLRLERRDDAYTVLADLMARYRGDELRSLLPQDLRDQLLTEFTEVHSSGKSVFHPLPVGELERLARVQDWFGARDYKGEDTQRLLIRAYHEAGDLPAALGLAESMLRQKPPINVYNRVDLVREYVWLLIRTGAAERAVTEVDRFVQPRDGFEFPLEKANMAFEWLYRPLWLERARAHAVLKQWAKAEADLKQLQKEDREWDNQPLPAAALLAGFLREGQGDPNGAVAIWREAYRKSIATGPMQDTITPMLGSLSDEIKEADVKSAVDAFGTEGNNPIRRALQNKLLRASDLYPVYQEMWRSKRGRAYARQIATREISAADDKRVLPRLFLYELIHQGALPGELPAEQDELLWKLSGDMMDAYVADRLTEVQLAQIALTWSEGSPGFAWAALVKQLQPELRGPLAYFLAHRCRHLKKSGEEGLFKQAVADAPPSSSLKRLAEAELKRGKG